MRWRRTSNRAIRVAEDHPGAALQPHSVRAENDYRHAYHILERFPQFGVPNLIFNLNSTTTLVDLMVWRKILGRPAEICQLNLSLNRARVKNCIQSLRLSLLAALVIGAVWVSWAQKAQIELSYGSGETLLATADCQRNQPSPQSFDMNFVNANALQKIGTLQVLLHKSEGCLRVGQEFPFAGIKRDQEDFGKILRRRPFGTLRVEKLTRMQFEKLKPARRSYLSRRLASSPEELHGQFFVVVNLRLLSTVSAETEQDAEDFND